MLNAELPGQYVSALLADLTLSSDGSLDHRDMLEGQGDDKGQDDEMPEFARQPLPPSPPTDHTAPSGPAALSESGRSIRMSGNSASVTDTCGATERLADGPCLPADSVHGPMEQVSVL